MAKEIPIKRSNAEQSPKRKFKLSRRGPYLLVTIFVLLVAVGIEITKDLGWLTAQDWVNDFVSIIGVFALVIFTASIFAVIFFTILRRLKKGKSPIDWEAVSNKPSPDKTKEK